MTGSSHPTDSSSQPSEHSSESESLWVADLELSSQLDLAGDRTLDQSVEGDRTSGNQETGFTLREDADFHLPEVIGGYKVGRRLGRGGMGEVYLAEHMSMGRMVALKILPTRWLDRASSVNRFYEEIRAASQLMHPNIVTAFDAGQADGIHYLAMEYVRGQTLSRVIVDEGPMSVGDATSAIRQAAFALHHAHKAGVIHRDVKPGNLMRSEDGTIKLLDLGLARFSKEWHDKSDIQAFAKGSEGKDDDKHMRRKRSLLGTLSFVSPEQLEDSESADARSDQYSLGATLFFLLIGQPPYAGEMLDQIYGHRHGEIPDLMALRSDVDLTLANVFRRMMAKSPSERYGSMDEVARAMAPYDSDRSTPAWVRDFAMRKSESEGSTSGGVNLQSVSTRRKTLQILGINLGLTHLSTALTAGPTRIIAGKPAHEKSGPQDLFRLAVVSKPSQTSESAIRRRAADPELLFGAEAYAMRATHPRLVAHCQLMYVGREDMMRQLGGRLCPPEVAAALCLRRAVGNTVMHQALAEESEGQIDLAGEDLVSEQISSVLGASWQRHPMWPDAVAIAVPGCYDQMHRRAIYLAGKLAGLPSIRLVDRAVAIARVALQPDLAMRSDFSASAIPTIDLSPIDGDGEDRILYVGFTQQAFDVSVLKHSEGKLQQLSTAGHWHLGGLAWAARLVELIQSQVPKSPPRSPGSSKDRRALRRAVRIQLAGEKAMNTLLLLPQATIEISLEGKTYRLTITRDQWLEACEDLIEAAKVSIRDACERASIDITEINRCHIVSRILQVPAIRERLMTDLPSQVQPEFFDGGDAACGAVAGAVAELPAHKSFGQEFMPPARTIASHSVGFVVADGSGKRKILPIIPRGAGLPARTNRQLSGVCKDGQMKLALVESSGLRGEAWQALGRHTIDVDAHETTASRRLGFEIDINGLLSVHMERPDLERTLQLPALPAPAIEPSEWMAWQTWIESKA